MHVAICTPCYDGRVHEAHARSVDAAIRHLEANGATVMRSYAPGMAILHHARNVLVAEALSKGADHVVFVDSDIAAGPEIFEAVLSHKEPVIGAVASARPGTFGGQPHLLWSHKANTAVRPDGLIEARRLGTAFLRVDRLVFEKLRTTRSSRPYIVRGQPNLWPFLSEHFAFGLTPVSEQDHSKDPISSQLDAHKIPEIDRVELEGEDYVFSAKVIRAGYTLWADARCRVKHFEGRHYSDYCLADALTRSGKASSSR
jgi:hypothetical protein